MTMSLGQKSSDILVYINEVRFSINRPGLLYGQRSEICGAKHRFIPIVVERVSTNQFINRVSKIRESSDDWNLVMVS
jgi:heme/copper-type cytochrome/quinol oxidase subunit 2